MNKYIIDLSHSEVLFKVKHMMISNVTGKIENFEATLTNTDNDFNNSKVTFKGDASTITTGNSDRDNHLKSADFFDVENYSEILFESTKFDVSGKIEGNLTIKGISKPVSFNLDFSGPAKDPWGNDKLGMSISGKINRKDWGLNWNSALETGGVLVSEEVKFEIELQFIKQ